MGEMTTGCKNEDRDMTDAEPGDRCSTRELPQYNNFYDVT